MPSKGSDDVRRSKCFGASIIRRSYWSFNSAVIPLRSPVSILALVVVEERAQEIGRAVSVLPGALRSRRMDPRPPRQRALQLRQAQRQRQSAFELFAGDGRAPRLQVGLTH